MPRHRCDLRPDPSRCDTSGWMKVDDEIVELREAIVTDHFPSADELRAERERRKRELQEAEDAQRAADVLAAHEREEERSRGRAVIQEFLTRARELGLKNPSTRVYGRSLSHGGGRKVFLCL